MSETLYNIIEAENEIERFEGMEEEEKKEYLLSIQEQKENKIDATFRIVKEYEAKQDAIKKEIERLKKIKEHYEKRSERTRLFVLYAMENWNITRIEGKTGYCYTQNSESTNILNKEGIPEKYITEKKTYTFDKKEIKKAIKRGDNIWGAEIVSKKSLIIK